MTGSAVVTLDSLFGLCHLSQRRAVTRQIAVSLWVILHKVPKGTVHINMCFF
jgi:hypothetical protein